MKIQARLLGLQSYSLLLRDMRQFTEQRGQRTADEIWVVEHPPVYTRGQRESRAEGETIVVPGMGPVPVIASDRGGLMTYHGPGQMIFYVLIDLKRSGVGVRRLVAALEQAVIDLLRNSGIDGDRIDGAPGVFVNNAKIASLGLRIRRGATYHGLSLNVDMDMAPFGQIDPCGVPDQPMTQLRALGVPDSFELIADKVCRGLSERLGYTVYSEIRHPRTEADSLDDGEMAAGSSWPRIEAIQRDDDDTDSVESDTAMVTQNALHEGSERESQSIQQSSVTTPAGPDLISHLMAGSDDADEYESHAEEVPEASDTASIDLSDIGQTAVDADDTEQRLSSISDAHRETDELGTESAIFGNGSVKSVDEDFDDHATVRDARRSTVDSKADSVSDDDDDDLGFLAPSNVHELIKDSNKDSNRND